MDSESRVRITLLLPFPETRTQYLALAFIFHKLTKLCGGITTSPVPKSAQSDLIGGFDGRWLDPEDPKELLIQEGAILAFADAPPDIERPELNQWLETLKLDAQHDFNQKIIWLTTHHVERTAAYDFQR